MRDRESTRTCTGTGEGQREREGEREREREGERILSRLHAVSTEPDVGLELMNLEITEPK